MKILILGTTGMLGHKLFEVLSLEKKYTVYGTTRQKTTNHPQVLPNIDVHSLESVFKTISQIKPDWVINCIGIIKQLPDAKDSAKAIEINAMLPHQAALYCQGLGIRFLQISTDCVFDGKKGSYQEQAIPSAVDLYGQSKFLGEVTYANCLTLRTSIIGHELNRGVSLIDWFLAQTNQIKGFTKAIYTGLTTLEFAQMIKNIVIPNSKLQGLYQVSSEPISKYDLLKIVAKVYGKTIEIVPDHEFQCDRSLNSSLFKAKTGYQPPAWPEMIEKMHQNYLTSDFYTKR